MAERGIKVDHSTLHRWVVYYASKLEKAFHQKNYQVFTHLITLLVLLKNRPHNRPRYHIKERQISNLLACRFFSPDGFYSL